MNKKFTFMVAALLAAGSFSAKAQTVVPVAEANSTKYYHLVIDADNGEVETGDAFVRMSVANDGDITLDAVIGIDAVDAKTIDNYLWKVVVTTKNGAKEVKIKNKKTGFEIAVNDNDALLNNAYQYTSLANELDNTLDLDVTNQTLSFATGKNLNLSSETVTLGNANTKVALVEPENTLVSVDNLVNLGSGINLTFAGTPTGTEVFQGVSVVKVGTDKFYLVKGTPAVGVDVLSEKNTLVVLSATSGITGQDAPNGYTYTTVKGDKVKAGADYKKGEYPLENAQFKAYENVNFAGKIALSQEKVNVIEGEVWKAAADDKSVVYVSATGNTGAALVNAQNKPSNAAWLTPSLGTAVEVKSLVKGQWIVNILASENKESAEMVSVVYSTQVSTGSSAEITAKPSETNKHKDEIYSQWVVSADKDANTVTFINRETGVKIAGVTLFKTPKANVYTTVGGNDLFKDKFIELRTVENATQFDGYLNLDKDGLDSEYTLSVDATNPFADYQLPVVVKNIKHGSPEYNYSVLAASENKDDQNVFTFKLAQSKDSDSKLDTVFVKEVTYGYYKDGKFTTAKDTLKAISYNFTSLKNAGKNAINTTKDNALVDENLNLWNSEATGKTSGKFVLRKVGNKYQILKAEAGYSYGYASLSTDANKFYTYSTIEGAQSFTLNAVAIAPSYDMPESHVALEINGAYLGSKADGNAIMTNDTLMLKSTAVDAAFSFYAFSADKEAAKTPSYYLSSNGKMMNDAKAEYDAIKKELDGLSPVFDAEKIKELKAKLATYHKDADTNKSRLVKFQQAKYVDAEHIALAKDTVKGDALKSYKFNVLDVDGQAVLKNASAGYVQVLNDAVVFTSDFANAAKFDVVAAEAPTSNEGVSATEVKVVANNGSIVVKNAAGKNVVVSTILGQVVANEVLTSDNATINVPAGIVVVAVEGESFKVNVK